MYKLILWKKGMNKNRITFTVCILVVLTILCAIAYYVTNGVQIMKLNNMYKDIRILENKISLYYLDNGTLPIKGESIIYFSKKAINPNDNENYYEIDLERLEDLNITYGKGFFGINDKYIINEQSHTIYYYSGIEYKDEILFTRDLNYEYVDLENY